MRQLSEAQDLKDHVDRREQAVSRVLGRCLSPEQHRDYRYSFTNQIYNVETLPRNTSQSFCFVSPVATL